MSTSLRCGSLLAPSSAPLGGERFEPLLAHGNVEVEQILSGESDQPVDYLQDHDEWVTLLAGGAVLDVEVERLRLRPGDWVFLPARVPHRVVSTAAGTSWLAVHVRPLAEASGPVGGPAGGG